MGGYVEPTFAPLVKLASHLVRCMHTETIDPESDTFVTFKDHHDQTSPSTILKGKIMIAEDTWWLYFTDPDFFEIVIKNGYEAREYGKGLAHVCSRNKKLSR